MLAWLAAGDDLAEFVRSVKKPTVDFSLRRPHLPFPRVVQDHAKVGHLAAEHFLERGLEHFLCCSDSDNWSQKERGEGFITKLEDAGRTCQWLCWHKAHQSQVGSGNEWLRRRRWLLTSLQRSPKPVAVFTTNGVLAVELQEVCENAGIAVPAEVAIVGIEDLLLSVGAANRAISGVDTNLEEQGYQGAALLDRLMHGGKPPTEPIRIAPGRVITRKSSDILAIAHQGISRALHYIAEHFTENISVDDVARAAGMSRRGLHGAFDEHLHCTPGDKLRNTRLDHIKRQLADTDHKIESIALESGYGSLNAFFTAFRKAEKMTPAEYRKLARRAH